MSVRKFLIGFLTSLVIVGACAGEASTTDSLTEEGGAQAAYTEALVTVAPVPKPATVIELASYSPKSPSAGQSKRVKAATVARARSMLSRSTRGQIALASNSAKVVDDRARLAASDNEDADTGLDELDLHRSFSQPKVAKIPGQTDDSDDTSDLPEHVKLRLLMARTKAVDAYVLSQAGKTSVPDTEELSDTVKLRLQIARLRAVKLHGEIHGTA